MRKDLTTDGQTGSDDPTSGATSQVDGQTGSKSQDSGAQNDSDGDGQLDVAKLDPKVQKLISDLRKENGDHRKKNKALSESQGNLKKALIEAGIIENDEEDPKEKLAQVSQSLHGASVKNIILEAAIEHGVGKENLKFFEFLIQDKLSQLKDGEEMGDEDLAALALEARGRSASGTTSVGDGKGSKPNPQGSGEVTLDQFANMNMTDKTLLFKRNPDLYNRLFAEAKSKKLLVK